MLCLPPMKARLAAASPSAGVALSACSSMHMPKIWPFYKKPKPAPEAVHELDLVNADGTPASYPQYWKRNTLVIDLSGVGGTGSVAARLPRRDHLAGARRRARAPGQRAADRNPGRGAQRAARGRRGHVAHRPRARAQRVHAADRGYLHLVGSDAGSSRKRRSPTPRSGLRVADAGCPQASSRRRKNRAERERDHSRRREAAPAQPAPPPGS